jgi:disulfide bond formation protein DsbB
MAAKPLTDDILAEPRWIALAMLLLAGAAILAALGFEHLGGYQPCALCLMQRTPYYVGIPIAIAALLAILWGAPRRLTALLFTAFGLLMLYDAGLAIYHSGVEWAFWEGPASCAPSVSVQNAADMLNQLTTEHAPSCTQAAGRFLGLSFANANVVVTALLAALGFRGAVLSLRRA